MLRFVRRALAVAAFAFVVAPAAQADPGLTATATPAVGAAPLNVTLTASGDDAAFHWVLGDGTFADGATVHHVYPAGAFTAMVTATRPDGTTAQATATI